MEKIRKNFGFGCMRLPMIGEDVDIEQTKQMVDCFLEQGFNYFDTAHGYLQGKSELALKECLTSRYPREDYVLTDKLSGSYFKKEEDIRPFFESQLAACGVDYFDFYLMHSQSTTNYQHYRDCRAYETAFALKAEGKVRHVGISFHDRAAVLEQILTDYPAIEVVQIQFNYLDYDDVAVQSRKCYEVCRRHGKPVLVMEPVKGGSLVNLPDDAKAVLDALHGGSPASYAIRFAAGFPGMMMVLSGMSNMEQMKDNLSYMRDFKPLNETELAAVKKVQEIFHSKDLIPCTACRGSRYAPEADAVHHENKHGGAYTLPELMDMDINTALTACTDLKLVTQRLKVLQDLGLGYLTLGEETPSLSGGEAQRLKLASEMGRKQHDAVFVFDEPTIGLHPLDVRVLLHVFDELVANGATVVVIEHDLDVIANADYVVDMGPGGGEAGGRVVCEGAPSRIAACPESVTGRYLQSSQC